MTIALTLTLSDEVQARLQAAAAEAGLSPEAWAARALGEALGPSGLREDAAPFETARADDLPNQQTPEARDYQQAASLAALEEYDRTGEYITLDEWAAEFREDVEARLAAR